MIYKLTYNPTPENAMKTLILSTLLAAGIYGVIYSASRAGHSIEPTTVSSTNFMTMHSTRSIHELAMIGADTQGIEAVDSIATVR